MHTSVRAPLASTSAGGGAARYASSSDLTSSEDEEDEDVDADEHAEPFASLRRRRHARKDKKRCAFLLEMDLNSRGAIMADDDDDDDGGNRLDHEDARAHGRIPTIPVPDVRFEQSYLMSIQRTPHLISPA